MKTEEELKNILVHVISYFELSDDSKEVIVWDRMVEKYTNFEGGELIKNKTYNLLKMLNEAKQTSEEEYQKVMKRDIETDLWYVL